MADSQPRWLVTGGTGFLGSHIARRLIADGIHPVLFDIAPLPPDDDDIKDQVTVIDGDVQDREAIRTALDGVSHVIHTAAALPLYPPQEIFTTDVDGTRIVLETAQALGVPRVVHISSTAVYGIPDHHPLLETDRLDGVGPYGKAKIAAEMIAVQFRERGLVVPILRPKSFVGPERLGVFALLYDWALDGRNFPMIGSGRNRYQLLDVADLCDAIWLCLTLPAAQANHTFNIGAAEFQTMAQDYQAVLDAAGFGKRIIGFPAAPAIWTLRLLDRLGLSPLYTWVYETAAKDSFVSIERARMLLGWEPRYSNQQALLRNFDWYIASRAQFAGESGITHRVPWKQGALGVMKKVF